MAFCANCGAALADGAAFCAGCGKPVEKSNAAANAGTTPAPVSTPAAATGAPAVPAGTVAASTGSASVNLPGGISVISASTIVDLTIAKAIPLFLDGERVNRIEVAATFGGPSTLTYITQSGRRIKRAVD